MAIGIVAKLNVCNHAVFRQGLHMSRHTVTRLLSNPDHNLVLSDLSFVVTPEFGQSTRWLSMIYHLEKLTQKEITPSLAMVHSFGRWVIPYSTVLSRTDSISHHLMSYRKVRLTQSEFRFLLMWFIYSTRIPERLCTKVCPEIARPPWNTRGVLT